MKGRFGLILLLLSCLACPLANTQKHPEADTEVVARAGYLNTSRTEYNNDYFGIRVRLPQPNASVTLNSGLDQHRVILLRAVNEQEGAHNWHRFGVEAQSADIPGLTSITQFVQSIRHQQERDGFQTIQAEGYRTIGGREFVVSELKIESQSEHYYQAIMFTRTKGYLLGFWIDAKTQVELEKAMKLEGRVNFK